MDGGKTRGRTYRKSIIEVLSDYWELTLHQRSSVVDSLSNHIIRRGRCHPATREWEPLDQKLRFMSSFISAAKNVNRKYDVHYVIFKLSYPVARERIENVGSSKEMSIFD